MALISRTMNDQEIEAIAERVAEILSKKDHLGVSADEIEEIYGWAKKKIETEKDNQDIRKQVMIKVASGTCLWAIPVILLILINSFWHEILRMIRQ